MDAFDRVTISQRGGLRPVVVPVTAPQASWELNAAGAFSAFARIDDLRHAGLWPDLRGCWLEWVHPIAGRWGGVITGTPVTDGLAEIAADGWLALLQGRVLADGDLPSRTPGGLAHLAVLAAGREHPTFIAIGRIDGGGEPLGLTFNGDVGNDLLPQIAEGGSVEWIIDADRVFHCGRRLGTDFSGAIRLIEDVDVTAVQRDNDLLTTAPAQRLLVQEQAAPPLTGVGPGPVSDGGGTGAGGSAFAKAWSFLLGGAFGGFGSLAGSGGNFGSAFPVSAPSAIATQFTQLAYVGAAQQQQAVTVRSLPQGTPSGSSASAKTTTIGWGFLQLLQAGIIGGFWNWPGKGGGAGSAPPLPPWSDKPAGIGANSPMQPAPRYSPPPTVPMQLSLLERSPAASLIHVGDMVRLDAGSISFRGFFRVVSKAIDTATGAIELAGEAMET